MSRRNRHNERSHHKARDAMTQRTVVILGGTGFVGSHLVPTLLRKGWQVRVPSRNRNLRRDLGTLPGVQLVTANVQDPAQLTRLFSGASVVINLVGILNETGRDGSGFRRAHVDLTRRVIAACERSGVQRLLQMSALNAGRGSSHYLRSRGEADALVRDSGLDWTIFQPSVIFGPGDGLFMRFAALLQLSPVLPLARAGARFAPVYVGDVVAAFLRALDDSRTAGRSYELYGPQVWTLAEIVRYTAQKSGMKRLVIPVPDLLGRVQAALLEFVPGKPFSMDNFRSLQLDSVGGIDGLFALGIEKTPIESVVPAMLAKTPRQVRMDRARARP
jgi:uncharacterized protein YbjT (DUF2867 family)